MNVYKMPKRPEGKTEADMLAEGWKVGQDFEGKLLWYKPLTVEEALEAMKRLEQAEVER